MGTIKKIYQEFNRVYRFVFARIEPVVIYVANNKIAIKEIRLNKSALVFLF